MKFEDLKGNDKYKILPDKLVDKYAKHIRDNGGYLSCVDVFGINRQALSDIEKKKRCSPESARKILKVLYPNTAA